MSINGDDGFDLEIFPCAGGLAEGFRRAGVVFDMAIEIDANHCDSYEANLGHRPLQMDIRAFIEMLRGGWRPSRPIRSVVADPPCTPYSRAGKRLGPEDPRDMLEATCHLIALLKPSVYLIGNIPGLDDGPNLPIVQRTIGGLAEHGYCTADFARLDAAAFGVPQHRLRPWWYGHREGPCIQWPEPTHGDPEKCKALVLPGVLALKPWVTCRQALGHLPLEELGRPIRLRKRDQNSPQHGSIGDKPARVVGTSNLSDGNVLVHPTSTETRKKYRKNEDQRVKQGNRVGKLDQPSATVTAKPSRKGAGESSVFTLQPPRGSDGGLGGLNTMDEPSHAIVRNTHGNGSILLNAKHPPAELDAPSPDVGAKQRQAQVISMEPHHPPSREDEPAMTVRAGSGGGANRCMEWNDKHPVVELDEPATTVRGGGEGHSAPPIVITVSPQHPASSHDTPSNTVRATTGGGSNRALEWPWDRAATTVQGDNRLAPPGHHSEAGGWMSDQYGVVISEKAAAILQGFPIFLVCACGRKTHNVPWEPHDEKCGTCDEVYAEENWKFSGQTKKQRWAMLGMAMPAPFAEAVARAVVQQLDRTRRERMLTFPARVETAL